MINIWNFPFYSSYRAASIGDAKQVEIYLKNGADTSIKETNFGKDVFKIAEELAQESVIHVLRSNKWIWLTTLYKKIYKLWSTI